MHGPILGAGQRATFFSRGAAYVIAGCGYSADDMEHGVLRGNRPGAASLASLLGVPHLGRGPFAASDPRAAKVLGAVDPRIHFALVCGAKSCPPIKLYAADTLEEGLAAAAEAFCASEVSVDAGSRTVTLSKIFSWYGIDFGRGAPERLARLLPWLPTATAGALRGLLGSGPPPRLAYKPYDWSLNSDE